MVKSLLSTRYPYLAREIMNLVIDVDKVLSWFNHPALKSETFDSIKRDLMKHAENLTERWPGGIHHVENMVSLMFLKVSASERDNSFSSLFRQKPFHTILSYKDAMAVWTAMGRHNSRNDLFEIGILLTVTQKLTGWANGITAISLDTRKYNCSEFLYNVGGTLVKRKRAYTNYSKVRTEFNTWFEETDLDSLCIPLIRRDNLLYIREWYEMEEILIQNVLYYVKASVPIKTHEASDLT